MKYTLSYTMKKILVKHFSQKSESLSTTTRNKGARCNVSMREKILGCAFNCKTHLVNAVDVKNEKLVSLSKTPLWRSLSVLENMRKLILKHEGIKKQKTIKI